MPYSPIDPSTSLSIEEQEQFYETIELAMVENRRSTPLQVRRGGRYLEQLAAISSTSRKTKTSCGFRSAAPPYKGVRMRVWGKWVTEVRDPVTKTRIWLGSFATAEMAARAYDAAVVCLKGLSAPEVNFPDSIPSFVIPQSNSSPKEIQAVALAAATASVPAATPLAIPASDPSSSVENWINAEFDDEDAPIELLKRQISDSVEQAFLPWPETADDNEDAFDCFQNELWSFS